MRPERAVAGLCGAMLRRLHEQTVRVLRAAADAGAEPARMPEDFLLRRRGPGGCCPRCGAALARARVAGRTACFCPRCQA